MGDSSEKKGKTDVWSGIGTVSFFEILKWAVPVIVLPVLMYIINIFLKMTLIEILVSSLIPSILLSAIVAWLIHLNYRKKIKSVEEMKSALEVEIQSITDDLNIGSAEIMIDLFKWLLDQAIPILKSDHTRLNDTIKDFLKYVEIYTKKEISRKTNKNDETISVTLFESKGNHFSIYESTSHQVSSKVNKKLAKDDSLVGFVSKNKKALCYDLTSEKPEFFSEVYSEPKRKFNSILCMPIISDEDCSTVLSITSEHGDVLKRTFEGNEDAYYVMCKLILLLKI